MKKCVLSLFIALTIIVATIPTFAEPIADCELFGCYQDMDEAVLDGCEATAPCIDCGEVDTFLICSNFLNEVVAGDAPCDYGFTCRDCGEVVWAKDCYIFEDFTWGEIWLDEYEMCNITGVCNLCGEENIIVGDCGECADPTCGIPWCEDEDCGECWLCFDYEWPCYFCGEQDCTCCECRSCTECGFLGGEYGYGRVLNNGDVPALQDALVVLRHLVGLPTPIATDDAARAAAAITNPTTGEIVMQDALAILRFAVGLASPVLDLAWKNETT
jgi:hypothetical protein